METSSQRRGLYYEEFEIGQRIITPARTLTESDIVNFAGVSGDFTSIHTDAVYTSQTPFGERVAHGLLVITMASGLIIRTGVLEDTVLAFREITGWKFSKPVMIGDTIRVEAEVVEKKEMPRLGGGSVAVDLKVINQKDEITMRGQWIVLVLKKP